MITSSIVTYNTKQEELKRLLKCVESSNIDLVYIIDNSPTDSLRLFVNNLSIKILYKYNNGNLGYGGGHNVALQMAIDQNSDYHIVLNPDIYFAENTIEELSKYMDNNLDIGAIMPKVIYPNGEIQYLCKLQATPLDLIGRRFLPNSFLRKRNDRYELRESDYNKIMNVPCLSGCFMFLRVSILEEVGFFDDRFFMYCEDFDYYKRIHQKYKTVFYPKVIIIHDHKKESYINKRMMMLHIQSAIKYFNKWGWFIDVNRRRANQNILKLIKYDKNNE